MSHCVKLYSTDKNALYRKIKGLKLFEKFSTTFVILKK
jgi:hypothetical protein